MTQSKQRTAASAPVADPTNPADAQQSLVGISISASPDLDRLGFGEEHLSELMGSIARAVLRLPDRETALVYGGDLRPGGFTRYLFEIVASERAESTEARPEPPRRLYNYLAWPHYSNLSKTHEAQMINLCHFVRVTPEHAGLDQAPNRQPTQETHALGKPPDALVASRCLTLMRELATNGGHEDFQGIIAPALRARILLGGAVSGYSSFMPGLFEEFLIAREPGPDGRPPLPVYVIGAFGGAAGQLAAALLDPANADPLTLDNQTDQDNNGKSPGRLSKLLALYREYGMPLNPEDRYQALRECVDNLGALVRGNDENRLDNGLTPEENRILLTTRDELMIRSLIQRGLSRLE